MAQNRVGGLRVLSLTSLAHFVNDGTGLLVPIVVDYISLEGAVPPVWITAILTAYYLTSTLPSTVVGGLADRSSRPALYVSAGLTLLSAGLLGFYFTVQHARGLVELVLATTSSALMGFGSSFYHPIGGSMLQHAFEGGGKSRALGVNGAFGSLGSALYPVLFFALAAPLTEPGALVFFAIVGLASATVILEGSSRRVAEARPEPKAGGKAASPLPNRGLAMLAAIAFARSAATQGFVSWLPVYLTHAKGLGLGVNVGLGVASVYAGAIAGQLSFGYLADRFERRLVLAASCAGSALSLLAAVLTPGFTETLPPLFAYGFFTFNAFPLFLSLASDYGGSSSLGNALVWGLGIGGGSVLAPTITLLLATGSYGLLARAFTWLSLINLAVAALTPLLPPTNVRKTRTPH